jgi:hypothetical protein
MLTLEIEEESRLSIFLAKSKLLWSFIDGGGCD